MPRKIVGEVHYNMDEAAKELCVSPFTIREYRARGLIQGSKLGRTVWFSESELREFVNAGGSERVVASP